VVVTLTAAELLQMPQTDSRLELVGGELRKLPFGGALHGMVTMKLAYLLNHLDPEEHHGQILAAGTGYWLEKSPDTVLTSDLTWLARKRLEKIGGVSEGFIELTPDLVAETVDFKDTYSQVMERVQLWLRFGVRFVFLIEPQSKTVLVATSIKQMMIFGVNDVLELPEVLPGFSVRVAEIFNG
jgi:Uma2 family endonuclease